MRRPPNYLSRPGPGDLDQGAVALVLSGARHERPGKIAGREWSCGNFLFMPARSPCLQDIAREMPEGGKMFQSVDTKWWVLLRVALAEDCSFSGPPSHVIPILVLPPDPPVMRLVWCRRRRWVMSRVVSDSGVRIAKRDLTNRMLRYPFTRPPLLPPDPRCPRHPEARAHHAVTGRSRSAHVWARSPT